MIRGVSGLKLGTMWIGIHTEKSRTVERVDIGRMENCRRNMTVALFLIINALVEQKAVVT